MARLLRLLWGRWRLIRGYCPSCNSDAPAIGRCGICNGGRLQLFYYPMDDHTNEFRNRRIAWARFKELTNGKA